MPGDDIDSRDRRKCTNEEHNPNQHIHLPGQGSTGVSLDAGSNIGGVEEVVSVRDRSQGTLWGSIFAFAKVITVGDSESLASGVQRLGHANKDIVFDK